jgi:hypothetical protein
MFCVVRFGRRFATLAFCLTTGFGTFDRCFVLLGVLKDADRPRLALVAFRGRLRAARFARLTLAGRCVAGRFASRLAAFNALRARFSCFLASRTFRLASSTCRFAFEAWAAGFRLRSDRDFLFFMVNSASG